jgi:hypothetical protein
MTAFNDADDAPVDGSMLGVVLHPMTEMERTAAMIRLHIDFIFLFMGKHPMQRA